MIEVALAMAIIAFGMTSILGLFPVGLNALRNSMAENFCAETVENIMGFMKNYAEYSPASYKQIFVDASAIPSSIGANAIVGTTQIPGVAGANKTWADIDIISKNFIAWYQDPASNFANTGGEAYRRVISGANLPIFRPKDDPKFHFVYFIVKSSDSTTTRNMDFSARVVMKKATVPVQKYATGDPDLDPWGNYPVTIGYPATPSDPEVAGCYNEFGAIIFEVSWPLEVKYSEREKRYYYMVVSMPK